MPKGRNANLTLLAVVTRIPLNGSSGSHHIPSRQMDNRRNSAEQQKALKGRKSGAVYIGYCTIMCYSHNYYHC
ncbi:unnamed protein product [Brugia timori]|uniref:Uncharacterized protein n=1 Tax=Brugia timori TaxID=42155 RepID=A0A3P7WRQ7_9BILA|nr:unnamed protein product [Brugia timori]